MARPRSFDEAQVTKALRNRFWESGYAGTSLDDLTAATGLGKGSLYGAFGDKRTLFGLAFETYCADAIARAQAALDGPDAGALDRLRAWLLGRAEATAKKPRRGCFLAKAAAELGEHDREVAVRARDTYAAIEDAIVACLTQAQRHGDLSASTKPRRLGALLLAVERGLEARSKVGASAAELRGIAEEALAALPVSR